MRRRCLGAGARLLALGVEPEPWTVRDCLAIEKLLTAGLSMRPDQDVILGLLDLLLGPELFADVYRYPPFDREYVVPDFAPEGLGSGKPGAGTAPSTARRAAADRMHERLRAMPRDALVQAVRALRGLDLSQGGSNNQAISGAHTASGAPILLGDSHQGVAHPAIYYLVHLRATDGSLDVVGASFPGVPFVVFGHNGVGAFTPTTSIYDSADAYLETFDAASESVTFEGKAVPVDARDEVIRVRGAGGSVADAEARTVRLFDVPHHGPMLPAAALGLPIPLDISIRWAGYQARSAGRAFWGMNTARDFAAFRGALEALPSGGYVDLGTLARDPPARSGRSAGPDRELARGPEAGMPLHHGRGRLRLAAKRGAPVALGGDQRAEQPVRVRAVAVGREGQGHPARWTGRAARIALPQRPAGRIHEG